MRRELLLQLQSMLLDLYRTNERVLDLADRSGLDVGAVAQSSVPKTTLWNILRDAELQGCLFEVIRIAHADYPRHAGLAAAENDQLRDVPGPWVNWQQPAGDQNLEVVTGQDDLMPTAFLAAGAEIAKSVVRIKVGPNTFGSGFAITSNLILTNHHVLPTREAAATAKVEFGVEETLAGLAVAGAVHETRPDIVYAAHAGHDWAVVAIEPKVTYLPIRLETGPSIRVGERVYIIQHPGGGPRQVALGTNEVTYVDASVVQYLTDTRPGSSGSPVFDRKWRLVALHHSGGWISEPKSKQRRFRNEGIAIALVARDIAELGILK